MQAPEVNIGSPAPSSCGSSCVPQPACSKLGRDFSTPCLPRKVSQTSLHRPGGSTPGMPPPPPQLSGGSSCPGAGKGYISDRDQKAAPRGFGSSTGRGLMEARFRRTASAISVRGGEREKGANSTIGVSIEGGSTCSSSLAGNAAGNAGPSRSGTAPRQRSVAANGTSTFSAAHAQLMSQDGPRTSQGVGRRVMADDGLDVDIGLAERLRERIRSRLGGATGEKAQSAAEISAARETRIASTVGTSCSSRRAAESRLRRQPQTEPPVAQRNSPTSSVTACPAAGLGLRPSGAASASTLGISPSGPPRATVGPVVKAPSMLSTKATSDQSVVNASVRREASPLKPQRARSPPPVTTTSESAVITTSVTREPSPLKSHTSVTRESSPLKSHKSLEASRVGPSRSNAQSHSSLPTGPGRIGFVRSSSCCSRAGRSPSPSDNESAAPSRGPQLTRQPSGFFQDHVSGGSLRSSSSQTQLLNQRQAGAPPVATRSFSISRLVSRVHSDSGRSSGSTTPARHDESVEIHWDDDVQACAVAFERALSRARLDSDTCAELRRVRERYEALLRRAAPRPEVTPCDTALQSTVQKLERETVELRQQLAETRAQLEAARAHANSCHSILHIPENLQVSPQSHLSSHQGLSCSSEPPVAGIGEESPLPPMRRVFAPPTPSVVSPLKRDPGAGGHSQLSKSPSPLAWATLVDNENDMAEGDPLARHFVRTPPRAVSHPARPVSWTAPPVIRCTREDDEDPTILRVESPRGSDGRSPSPAPSRRDAMVAAWLSEIDPLARSCCSDTSDCLPQQPQRRAVCRPSSVPPLDLTCLAANCQEDSDGEMIANDDSYLEQSGLMVHQTPPPNVAIQKDISREVPGLLTDTCGSGSGSTASTRAASTPSANTAGGPPYQT